MDGDYDDPGPDNTVGTSESLDSDDVRNDDGEVVVDDPQPLDRGRRASEPRTPTGPMRSPAATSMRRHS